MESRPDERAPAAPRPRGRFVESTIAEFAVRQHGIVTRKQLLAAGVHSQAVMRRVAAGRLRPLLRGVYAVGPLPQPRAREMAALLACGPASAVSHRWAGAQWGYVPRRGPKARVEILIEGGRRCPRHVDVHRTDVFHPGEVVVIEGLRVTSPSRTLYDLAGTLRPMALERAVAHALREELVTADELHELVERYAGRRGCRRLRSIVQQVRPALTRSAAEECFLEIIRSARLPEPHVNVRIGDYEVDFYWPDRRQVVEIDGYGHHASREAFEADRRRDAKLATRGIQVVRITWERLTRERDVVLAEIARTLGPD